MKTIQRLTKKGSRKRSLSGSSSKRSNIPVHSTSSEAVTSPVYHDSIQSPLPDIHSIAAELVKDNSKDTRKGRSGTTLKLFFKSAAKNKVQIVHNRFGQPIGNGSDKFRSCCGVIARLGRLAPLTYPRWNMMPSTFKELHIEFLKMYFTFDESALESYIRKSIGQKWKDWKNTVHSFVDLNKSLEENMDKVIDERVDPNQWKQLVPVWFDKEYQVNVSEKAKQYKAKQDIFHTCGRKPYAQIREDLGHDVGDIEFFHRTHTHAKDGSVDPSVDEILEKCKNIIDSRNLKREEVEHSLDLQSEIFSEVVGKERNERPSGWGLGPTRSAVHGSKKVNKNEIEKIQKLYEAEMEKMRAQVEELKEEHKTEMAEMQVKIEAKFNEELQVQKKETDDLKMMFKSFISAPNKKSFLNRV